MKGKCRKQGLFMISDYATRDDSPNAIEDELFHHLDDLHKKVRSTEAVASVRDLNV